MLEEAKKDISSATAASEDAAASVWSKTKSWAQNNPEIAGATAGFAAGSVVPGVGNFLGAIGGAFVGHLHRQGAIAQQQLDLAKKIHDKAS